MSAVILRLRAELRARWRAWLALGVAIGVAGGAVVALAAAERRTQSAYGRYLQVTAPASDYVDGGLWLQDKTVGVVGRFAHLPQVVGSERTFIAAVASHSRTGRPVNATGPGHIQFQIPADNRPENTIDRPLLLSGRLPDPRRKDEVLADRRALATLGIGLGDTLTVRLMRRDFILAHLTAFPSYPDTAAWGPLVTVRVVGVQAQAKADADGGYVNFTPALRRANGGQRIGAWSEELAVRLRHGAADLPAFTAALSAAAHGHPFVPFDPASSRPLIRRSIDLMVRALLVLTVVGAAAALLLGGQATLRTALADAQATTTLRALGMTRPQLLALGVGRSAAQAVPAVVLTVATAVLLSPLAPVGWARELEPDRGIRFDALPIVVGAACVVAGVLGAGMVGGLLALRPDGRSTARTAGITGALARTRLPPVAGNGVAMALVRRARDTTVPVRATLGAAVVAVAVAVVAITLASSATHLLATPSLYGQTWDYAAGTGPGDRKVASDRAIAAAARSYSGPVTIGTRQVGARALADVKGRLDPTVLEGRAPRADDEALLGTRTLKSLHLRLGDSVTVHDGRRSVRLGIVGRGVLPTDKWTELGQGIVLRLAALHRISPKLPADHLLIRFTPEADRAATMARLDRMFSNSDDVRPQEIGDLGRVHGAPMVVALVVVAAAAAALAHLLLTTVRRRRRDLAILKTLGFTRSQVFGAVAWQATTVAAVGALVGVPLGIAVGRFAWNLIARDLGVAADPVTPVGLSLLAVPVAILLANAIAVLPARRAAAMPPALVLRAE